jgi:NADH-quinone oxidoreductase subunit G
VSLEIGVATIYIDNKPFEVDPNQSLLQACLGLGFNVPYFCWHPALGSVGACRQCAVKQFRDEKDTRGKIVMSCMTPASDGTRISIDDPEVVAFRAAVIEGLMLNHPHDCPVCDEGGECHLQDMTVMTGHDYRRTRYAKRTHRNQYLGPLINHEMNRCIQCYRCVRYYREYAGGSDLNAFSLNNTVYFGRYEEGALQNEFSGNLVEVCPTGVFTDRTLRKHYTRKWDLQMAPSVCVHCGLGCNTTPGERYGLLRRIVNRYNGEVNGYFLCDRGRYGYEFVNSEKRLRNPLLRQGGKFVGQTSEQVLEKVGQILPANAKVIGIGSPRASLESNFALRTLVGPERFFTGMSDDQQKLVSAMLDALHQTPARSASLRDVEQADAVLILGEDVTNVAPRMALALRQSVRQQPMELVDKLKIPRWLDHPVREAMQDDKGPLFIAAPSGTRLDDVATTTFRGAPVDLARLGFAVAHALDPQAPAVPGLADETRTLAERIASALKNAKRPLVVSGGSCHSLAIIQAAANVARALSRGGQAASLAFTSPECNSFGVALMGGGTLHAAFEAVEKGDADTVVILENNLYQRAPAAAVDAFLAAARHAIVLDHIATPTGEKAEVVLPVGTFAESDGTLVSSEGRAQRFFQVFMPRDDIEASWRWLRDIMAAVGRSEAADWRNLDDLVAAVASAIPALKGIQDAAPDSSFRIAGARVPRSPHRFSGRTAIQANINVSEPKPPEDADSALSFSMEGSPNQPPASLQPFFWAPAWNSIQSVNKFQEEITGPLRGGDAGVRLIEPPAANGSSYLTGIPPAFTPRSEEWLLLPLYHIFGSEELSSLAPAIQELAPQPYIALNPADAKRLEVQPGEKLKASLAGEVLTLPLEIRPDLPAGVAGLPAGVIRLEGSNLPAWSKVSKS